MNPTIDNIMALAVNLQDEAWNDGKSGVSRASERTVAAFDALRAAIEQAMGQGEPVARYLGEGNEGSLVQLYDDLKKGADLYTAPQPQLEQEPVVWIPVAQRMPESSVTVLAYYKNSHGHDRRIRALWVQAKTLEASGDWDGDCDYDEEADTYYCPQGWYECMDNWDEFRSIFVHEGEITHWMPLPPAPNTAPQPRRNDTAGKMIAAGNRMAAMLDTSLTAPIEQWPDEAEIDAALKEWRSVANGDYIAAAGKGIDDTVLLRQALEALDCIYSPLRVREINKVGAAIAALRERLK
jgi:hypothetical protein